MGGPDFIPPHYAGPMLIVLACPICLDARVRETRALQALSVCPNCGALLLLHERPVPHLVIVCRYCHEVFEGPVGLIAPGIPVRCPKCGTRQGRQGR